MYARRRFRCGICNTLMIYFSRYVVEGAREEHLAKILKNNYIIPFPRINKCVKVNSDV